MENTLKRIPFYALLFPAFTVLILAANNRGQIQLTVIWRPLLVAFIPALILLGVGWLIFRRFDRAGLFAFPWLFFALTYGHFYTLMRGRVIGTWVVGTHFWSLFLWLALFLLTLYFFLFKPKATQPLTLILNIAILTMTLFQVGRITIYQAKAAIARFRTPKEGISTLLQPKDPHQMPDVYFIILDKYGRSDALEAAYDYDNSDFIAGLEDLGFWVADCSRSNYAFTVMSLSSQLNMAFVDTLTDEPNLETTRALIRNNRVHQAFDEIGYTTIAFEMGYSWGNLKWFDYYFNAPPENIQTWGLDPFEILYLKGTAGVFIFENETALGEQVILTDIERKAARTQLILDVLPDIPDLSEPKFVHAHIITPHPPFIFNADGSLNLAAEETPDQEGYPAQLAFIEPRILAVVEEILANSTRPPIIILEGDHGFGKKHVTSNLLALYLPEASAESLDEHMTLVNVFPTIFNHYFGTDLELLPDLSYTHTKDWYESVLLDEWNSVCQEK